MAAWLEERRAAAAARDAELAVPTIRDEHWRYTNLRGIDFAAYPAAPAGLAGTAEGTLLLGGKQAGNLLMRDATVVTRELSPEAEAAGVLFLSLAEAVAGGGEAAAIVEKHLGTIVGTDEKFSAENAARWTDGALVYIPRGVELTDPLHVTFELVTAAAAQQWRLLVVAEEGARAVVVEEHAPGAPGYANGVAELIVGPAAKIEHVTIQNRHLESLHFSHHRARVERDAELDWVACSLGAKTGKSRMESQLAGPGSTAKLTGTAVIEGSRHLDLDTTQEHDAPHAFSDLFFKNVLLGRSRSVWRGVIRVAEGAQKTDSYQENRNLLLSPHAHADSIPGLEIKANDVRCTHGATISRVDQTLLFYLMSRGLPRDEAEGVIVEGFFADALARIGSEPVREAVAVALAAKLQLR